MLVTQRRLQSIMCSSSNMDLRDGRTPPRLTPLQGQGNYAPKVRCCGHGETQVSRFDSYHGRDKQQPQSGSGFSFQAFVGSWDFASGPSLANSEVEQNPPEESIWFLRFSGRGLAPPRSHSGGSGKHHRTPSAYQITHANGNWQTSPPLTGNFY